MIQVFKRWYYLYCRAMFYFGIALNEVRRPLQFWNETALILLLLAMMNIKPHWLIITASYVSFMIFLVILGKIIVWLGIVAYNNRLGNHQNNELMDVIERLKRIENKLNENNQPKI